MALIDDVLNTRSPDAMERFIAAVKEFRDWGIGDDAWDDVLMAREDIGCF